MKIRKLWIFLATIALVLLTCETALFAATIKTSDYWVMQDGYNELFVASGKSEYLSVTYGSYPWIEGDVFQVDYPGPLAQFLNYDASGNLVYYGATFYDAENGSKWIYTSYGPQNFFPAEMEVGTTFTRSWSRTEYKDGFDNGPGSDNFTITVAEELGVSVPAGTFDTYRMDVVDDYTTSTGLTDTTYRTYWLAKGVGWVKMKLDGVEYELWNLPPVSSLSVSPPSLTLSEGGTGSLAISGGTGPYFASSSNPAVATVTVSGSIVSVGGYAAGSVTVTVQDSASNSVTIPVTVNGATSVPSAPDLKVAKSGYTVTISWDAVAGATGYILFYAPYPDASYIESGDVGLNRYFSFEMPHGSAYYILIYAYNSAGWSNYSNLEYFVLDGLSSLLVNPSTLSLETGGTGYCTISGGNGYYGAYSSDTSVAAVSVTGSTLNAMGLSAGSASISVYDSESNVTVVSVTVTGDPLQCIFGIGTLLLDDGGADFDGDGAVDIQYAGSDFFGAPGPFLATEGGKQCSVGSGNRLTSPGHANYKYCTKYPEVFCDVVIAPNYVSGSDNEGTYFTYFGPTVGDTFVARSYSGDRYFKIELTKVDEAKCEFIWSEIDPPAAETCTPGVEGLNELGLTCSQ